MINLALTGPVATTLFNWLQGAIGIPVVWEEQNAPRPALPFGMIGFMTGPNRIGGLDELVSTTSGTVDARGRRELTVTVNVYSDDPLSMMSAALTALNRPLQQQAFQAAGIAYSRESGIQNLTQVFEDQYEGRAQMDVTFMLTDTVTDNTGEIDSVSVTDTIDGVNYTQQVNT